MSKSDIIIIAMMILSVFVLGFSVSQTIGTDNVNKAIFEESNTPDRIPESEMEIILNCRNLTLKETAYCLRDNIEIFYIYNVTDDDINLTLDQLKTNGGDCRNYAFLYEGLAKELGFDSDTRVRNGKADVFPGHRMTFMWDDKMYCKLDLLKVYCRTRLDNE